jgi:hypothetical protein
VAVSSDWERNVGSVIGLAAAHGWNRRVKRRLFEATVGDLAQGEKLCAVTYATRGDPPVILYWEAGVLAIWFVVMFLSVAASFQGILVLGWFCAAALWFAQILIGKRWVGVVLTDRRLILFRKAALLQRLRGIPFDFIAPLLEVSLAHTLLQSSRPAVFTGLPGMGLILGFDDTVGHDPVKLSFGGFGTADGEAFLYAVRHGPARSMRPRRPSSSP